MQSSIVSFVNELANQGKEEELKSFLRGIASFVKHADIDFVKRHLTDVITTAIQFANTTDETGKTAGALKAFMEELRKASRAKNSAKIIDIMRGYGVEIREEIGEKLKENTEELPEEVKKFLDEYYRVMDDSALKPFFVQTRHFDVYLVGVGLDNLMEFYRSGKGWEQLRMDPERSQYWVWKNGGRHYLFPVTGAITGQQAKEIYALDKIYALEGFEEGGRYNKWIIIKPAIVEKHGERQFEVTEIGRISFKEKITGKEGEGILPREEAIAALDQPSTLDLLKDRNNNITGLRERRTKVVFSAEEAACVADCLMMGEGDAGFNEDHIDFIQEVINQCQGSASTTVRSIVLGSIVLGERKPISKKDIIGGIAITIEALIDKTIKIEDGKFVCDYKYRNKDLGMLIANAAEKIAEHIMLLLEDKTADEKTPEENLGFGGLGGAVQRARKELEKDKLSSNESDRLRELRRRGLKG